MKPSRGILTAFFLLCSVLYGYSQQISLRSESLDTLRILVEAQSRRQISDPLDADYGAIRCPFDQVLHTRAAEAVYPMAVIAKTDNRPALREAAIRLARWLFRQQGSDGAWKETPEEWTGTTTDQLLMLVLAFPLLKEYLSAAEQSAWESSIRKAADYLSEVMTPEFASINYCTTTTASLALANRLFPQERYRRKARELADRIRAKMDDEGFICAEGDRAYEAKYGADIGYEMDMSLWGLALYARTEGDAAMLAAVRASLRSHLYFVYPSGAIDGSWGIRSNKWTTYGSQTADGCQILFSLFAGEDARYRTAGWRNLQYLRTMIRDGLIGYGPQYWELFRQPPCIYPTCMRSKNLALAAELGEQEAGEIPPLPSDQASWIRHFPTVDVVLVRTPGLMATVPAYRYKELQKLSRSKYMHRPSGGSLSNLWLEGHGFFQISSQTEYRRWEPMHFPKAENLLPLTPRIEFQDRHGYFTNLYEFDGRLSWCEGEPMMVSTAGELCDRNLLPGGVAYRWEHRFGRRSLEKKVSLRYHQGRPEVRIVEPVVRWENMFFDRTGPKLVQIRSGAKLFTFQVLEGDVQLSLGEQEDRYAWPFPSLKAFPITLKVLPPSGESRVTITYRFTFSE